MAAVHLWSCWRPPSNLIAQPNLFLFCFALNRPTLTNTEREREKTKSRHCSRRDRSTPTDTATDCEWMVRRTMARKSHEPSPFTGSRPLLVAEAVPNFFYFAICNNDAHSWERERERKRARVGGVGGGEFFGIAIQRQWMDGRSLRMDGWRQRERREKSGLFFLFVWFFLFF